MLKKGEEHGKKNNDQAIWIQYNEVLYMKKEREYKVIVKNPPTEKQKEEMLKRVEDYLSLVYSNVK